MITKEKISFKASKLAPSPQEADYWIDLNEDSYGNVIKSYGQDGWLPLNINANAAQFRDIQKLVDLLGFERDENGAILAPVNDLTYFEGDTILDMLNSADTALNQLTDTLEETEDTLEEFMKSKGQPNGLAELDDSGTVPAKQLPSYVDDVVDVYATYHVDQTGKLSNIQLYEDASHTKPVTGEKGKIYVNVNGGDTPWPDEDTVADDVYKNIPYQFRWSGSTWVHIDNNAIIIGEVKGTAFDGAKGKAVEDTVGSIDNQIVANIKDTTNNTDSTVSLQWSQGTKSEETGLFTFTEKNVAIPAANTEHAGVLTKDGFTKLETAATIPDKVLSDASLIQTSTEQVELHLVQFEKREGIYVDDQMANLVIHDANAERAGVMTSAMYTKLETTLPGQIEAEKTERVKKETEISTKHDGFEKKATEYKISNDEAIKKIQEDIKAITTGTGLQETDHTLPDTTEEDSHYIQDAKSVFGAVEALDRVVYEIDAHLHFTTLTVEEQS